MASDSTVSLPAVASSSGLPSVTALLRIEGLRKQYKTGRGSLLLFQDLSFSILAGDLAAIVGESGAGKSTLLHIMGALDRPTSGQVIFSPTGAAAIDLCALPAARAAQFRNREIGYVWQAHYLLPEFTAQENVAMPLLARGARRKAAMALALDWLAEVGLADRAEHRSGELSGGEQQRVSLARALVTQPRLLLADEPTGDLDERTAETVFSLIERLHAAHGLTSVLVTHNPAFARRCGRAFRMSAGGLQERSSADV